jgi:hypothetical protein
VAAEFPVSAYNTITAAKPGGLVPSTADPAVRARGAVDVLEAERRADGSLRNTGAVSRLHRHAGAGHVTVALVGERGGERLEATPRCQLPRPLPPGDTLELDAVYVLPTVASGHGWRVELVAERMYWFSDHGSTAAKVDLGEPRRR